MAKKKKLEVCVFCEKEVECPLEVTIGKCKYPMCIGCCGEPEKDGFSYTLKE